MILSYGIVLVIKCYGSNIMKRLIFLASLLSLLLTGPAFGADEPINERTELTVAPDEDDIVPIYDFSASAGKRIALLKLMKLLESALTSYAIHADNLPDLTSVYKLDREYTSQAFTAGETQTTVTEAHMLAARWITNQGGSAETDLILTAVSYHIERILVDEEGIGFEICPPSGESLYLDSEGALTVDHCVDHVGAELSRATLSRAQNSAGTWAYHIITDSGEWIDGNDIGD